jgi:hypothetical protein
MRYSKKGAVHEQPNLDTEPTIDPIDTNVITHYVPLHEQCTKPNYDSADVVYFRIQPERSSELNY